MTPRATWLSFAAVSSVILTAAGWLGATVWRQDAHEQHTGTLALWEQKVQAALWRMDAAAAAMVAREAARRPEEFTKLAKADTKANNPGTAGLQARSAESGKDEKSGLASPRSQGGRLTPVTPAVVAAKPAPAPAVRLEGSAAPAAAAPAQAAEENKNRYFSAKVMSKVASKKTAVKADEPAREKSSRVASSHRAADAGEGVSVELADKLPAPAAEVAPAKPQARYRQNLSEGNRAEAQIEAQVANSFAQRSAAKDSINSNYLQNDAPAAGDGKPAAPAVGALTALNCDNDLILARRVETRGGEIVQGVRLNTAAVSEELLALVRDDFPKAQLLPENANPPKNLARTLAALPLRFEPNEQPALIAVWTPTRSAVTTAGAALMVALCAVALLLARTLALSERRATFVSTMTHELRTPLTTFRLYTDLLEAAPEQTDRARYTQVLAREAERLSHLVENVLSYARLERGRAKPAPKAQTVDELLAPALDRLRERAERAGFTLELAPHDGAQVVKADAATVEQILLNLVDNAGKYAVTATDKRLVLSVGRGEISLRDFGPGLDPVMRKRLFTPFSRSDKEAAGNAPGVGLGLALCRRLAREMGGDLVYRKVEPGAEFALVLADK